MELCHYRFPIPPPTCKTKWTQSEIFGDTHLEKRARRQHSILNGSGKKFTFYMDGWNKQALQINIQLPLIRRKKSDKSG